MRTSSELPGHTLPPHAADVTGRPAEETTAPDAVKEARDDGDDATEEEEELIQGQESRESVATGTVGEDTASSLAVHGRVLVLGCGSGAVHVMDAWGNVMETRRHHAGSRVTGVSLDRDGEYFASCSEDGKVAVTGVSAENRDRVLQ